MSLLPRRITGPWRVSRPFSFWGRSCILQRAKKWKAPSSQMEEF